MNDEFAIYLVLLASLGMIVVFGLAANVDQVYMFILGSDDNSKIMRMLIISGLLMYVSTIAIRRFVCG